jgi:hypothetical protein
MRTIKAHFENGNTITTSINGTDDEIRRYYVGRSFNLGDGAGGDLMSRCTRVEFIGEPVIYKRYSDGWDARRYGFGSTNPHAPGSWEAQSWQAGWDDCGKVHQQEVAA